MRLLFMTEFYRFSGRFSVGWECVYRECGVVQGLRAWCRVAWCAWCRVCVLEGFAWWTCKEGGKVEKGWAGAAALVRISWLGLL